MGLGVSRQVLFFGAKKKKNFVLSHPPPEKVMRARGLGAEWCFRAALEHAHACSASYNTPALRVLRLAVPRARRLRAASAPCSLEPTRASRLQMFHGQVMQMLYGGSPNVSFFKGDGEPQLGPVLDMPDNSSSGAVSQFYYSRDQ